MIEVISIDDHGGDIHLTKHLHFIKKNYTGNRIVIK